MSESESGKGGLAQLVEQFAKPLGNLLTTVLPLVIQYGNLALENYRKLPQNFIEFCIGFIFCFFGGVYPTLFAAVQAAENSGRKVVMENLHILADVRNIYFWRRTHHEFLVSHSLFFRLTYQEVIKIIEESKKDDAVDADKDGKKDVTEISGREYMTRKTLLVLKKMNPDKVGNFEVKFAF